MSPLFIDIIQFMSLIGVPIICFALIIYGQAVEEDTPNCIQRADTYLNELEWQKGSKKEG